MADTTTKPAATETAPTGRVVTGIVTRDQMAKTRRVEIQRLVRHPKYGKFIKQRTVCYAHDEANDVREGDRVRVAETRPLSRQKRWRVVEVLERAR